jgi:hypothetical protein
MLQNHNTGKFLGNIIKFFILPATALFFIFWLISTVISYLTPSPKGELQKKWEEAKSLSDSLDAVNSIIAAKENADKNKENADKNYASAKDEIIKFLDRHSKDTTANMVKLREWVQKIESAKNNGATNPEKAKPTTNFEKFVMQNIEIMYKDVNDAAKSLPKSEVKSRNLTNWDTLSNSSIRKIKESNFDSVVVKECLDSLNKYKIDIIELLKNN